MHSKTKGNIGETAAALYLMKREYPVFTEMGDSCKVDLIALVENRPVRIQVKAIVPDGDNRIRVPLKSSGPNYQYHYTSDDVDVMCLYDLTNEDLFWVSLVEIESEGRKSITLVHRIAERAGGPKQNLASEYRSFQNAANKAFGLVV